ncbi:WD repeat-containing protein 92 [Sorochytrium milnesiophthora]
MTQIPGGALEKPQILCHISHSLSFSPFDARWVPSSARLVVLGQHARGTAAFNVYALREGGLQLLKETEKAQPFKCGTFGASALQQRHLATGAFDGSLQTWDLERLESPVYSVRAHESIVNAIDGAGGGSSLQCGPPELVTGSRDGTYSLYFNYITLIAVPSLGSVKVWDVRQKDRPVATIAPSSSSSSSLQSPDTGHSGVPECWAVAFGNTYNDTERCVSAGYANGDVKLFDLRTMKLVWDTNLRNGVCCVEFDRKDIRMNKLVATTLESSFSVYDLRTLHAEHGFASTHENTTIWAVRHLPQNRDVFLTSGGNGTLRLYKYRYPSSRSRPDDTDAKKPRGVAGTVEQLQSATLTDQPIASFDWSVDKMGLCAMTSFDQTVKVGIVTKLGQY